jgi:diaminopimelate epimerase
MSKIPFYKMSGGGNDFILIDNRSGLVKEDAGRFAARVCRRKFSVGADGLILIESSDKVDFRWRFHNSDGSEAEMCGNGGRCAARFAYILGIAKENLSFETKAGIIKAEVRGERVKLALPEPMDLRRNIEIPVDERIRILSFVNTSVPHAVKIVPNVDNFDVVGIGRKIRYHKEFQPAGTNVDFVQIIDEHNILMRTYERGVEDETLACGTGAVASAIIVSLSGKVKPPVAVKTRGGEILNIYFKIDHTGFKDVYLEGDTSVVYNGEIWEEGYKN